MIKKALYLIPLLVAGILWAMWRRKSPAKLVAREFAVLDAVADAKLRAVKQGADLARANVELQHKESLEKLTDDQKKQAAALRSDPARLAAFLVRAAD